jgi:hypothetical protein
VTAPATPEAERLRQVFSLVERHVESRWGIPVRVRDVPNPFTGDLDGAEIHVDFDLAVDDALFILLHLFGHTVQWNLSDAARAIGTARPTAWTEADLVAVAAYERDACAYSIALLHECDVYDLDGWVSDFAACDVAYLLHFYRTGQKLPFRSFWRDHTPVLPPHPIPAFTPTRWVGRWDGVVI